MLLGDKEPIVAHQYDGADIDDLALECGVPSIVTYLRVSSTLDVAQRLAAQGAANGTCVLAETQMAGRGRNGRQWSSPAGSGIWLTIIERPVDRAAVDVLSLRVGMAAARTLDRFVADGIQLKWPNDVYLDGRKVAGILVEARWRDITPEWVLIGIGVNIQAPLDQPLAIGLPNGVTRLDVLRNLIPQIRVAAQQSGELTDAELQEFAARDWARGKRCVEPVRGTVRGISKQGELIVECADDTVRVRSGSLVLE